MKLHKGDNVKILSGKDRGKTGKILRVYPEDSQVLVEGANMYKKHQRPRRQGEKGETVSVSRPLTASKVAIICPSCGKTARIGIRMEGEAKVRFCKKCQSSI